MDQAQLNLKLLEKLLDCWFAAHGGCSVNVSIESAVVQRKLVEAHDQNRAAGTAKPGTMDLDVIEDELHTKGFRPRPGPNFAISGVSCSSFDSQWLDNIIKEEVWSVQAACPTIPVELLV